MKTIYSMESDAKRLQETINILSSTKQTAKTYIDQWIDYNVLEYTAAKSRFLNDQKVYLTAKEKQQHLRDDLSQAEQEREQSQDRRRQLREQLIAMEAQRLGIDALQDKDKCEQKVESGKQQLQQQAMLLLEQDKASQFSLQATQNLYKALQKSTISVELPSLGQRKLIEMAKNVAAIAEDGAVDFPTLLGKDWVDLSPLEAHLETAQQNQQLMNQWRERWFSGELESSGIPLRDQLAKLVDRREQKLQNVQRQIAQKQSDIDSLEARELNYPNFVRIALETIRRECPQAEPCVLADYVEITDPQWQSAIEGYIGGARFSIIVETDYEAEAARIVRSIPGGSRARVVQGSKAKRDCERMKLSDNSIMNLMSFDHATARHYLQASYGSVEQVRDVTALRQTRRGVTKEIGRASCRERV